MTLQGKIALVTGASRGIGKSIANILAINGATVVGTATTEKGAGGITEYLQDSGGFGIVLDISNRSSVEEALAITSKKAGDPVIIVNNAGITVDNLFLRMKEEEWDKVLTTDLTGVFNIVKACIKPMLKMRWGRIINISSIVAFMGNAGQANYAAAKAGLIGFSKSLAREVASRGITVNVIAPGFIDTDMTKELSQEQSTKLKEQIPVGRIGSPEDIAHAVNFLAADAASYITGETIHVNGGMLMN
jgi:3-oxoacyl-[acyl-carrier protein] reductase